MNCFFTFFWDTLYVLHVKMKHKNLHQHLNVDNLKMDIVYGAVNICDACMPLPAFDTFDPITLNGDSQQFYYNF